MKSSWSFRLLPAAVSIFLFLPPSSSAQDSSDPLPAPIVVPVLGEIYPVVAVSMATVDLSKFVEHDALSVYLSLLTKAEIDGMDGIPNANLAVLLQGVEEGQRYSIEVRGSKFLQNSRTEGEIPSSGNVAIFPNLAWKFDELRANRNVVPENISLNVALDRKKLSPVTTTLRVRSSRDCPFVIDLESLPAEVSGLPTVSCLMAFAAFVNENHPVVDTVLSEALALGVVDSFLGPSQADEAQQFDELYAVWLALRKRGVQYGNLTQSSGEAKAIFAQNIRTIDESLASKQANCVDGTVLLASIYRKMGYDVALVLVPGHCYLSVIAAGTAVRLETTMIGEKQEGKTDPVCAVANPLDRFDQAARFFGTSQPDFGPDRFERGLFHAAVLRGRSQTDAALAARAQLDDQSEDDLADEGLPDPDLMPEDISQGEAPIRFVIIGKARELGVTPLE